LLSLQNFRFYGNSGFMARLLLRIGPKRKSKKLFNTMNQLFRCFSTVLIAALPLTGAVTTKALSWAPTSAPSNSWASVASSADGITLISTGGALYSAVPLYLSTNSGATWVQAGAPMLSWQTVACSANGNTLVAGYIVVPPTNGFRGGIYVSTNSGVVWTPTSAPSQDWQNVICSANGTKIVASSQYGMFHSADLGTTWSAVNEPTNNEFNIACSADGTRIIAAGGVIYNGPIYVSTNSGTTWTTASAPVEYWHNVASSADGMTFIAGGQQDLSSFVGPLYVSRDGGTSWNSNNVPNQSWGSVASSADGTRLLAVAFMPSGSYILYASTDSGMTWMPSEACPGSRVVSSADGGQLVCGTFQNTIYIAHSPVPPVLKAVGFNGSLLLGWTVPSMNFSLQQAPDLTSGNWKLVSTSPTLNYSDLQYQVSFPKPSGMNFYRLVSH